MRLHRKCFILVSSSLIAGLLCLTYISKLDRKDDLLIDYRSTLNKLFTGVIYTNDTSNVQRETELALDADEEENYIQISLDVIIEKQFEISQTDTKLIKKIRRDYLLPPSVEEYHLTSTDEDPSEWQANIVSDLLQKKKFGFFVEVGANDGEFLSNTLLFEKRDGWQGLLIEPNPESFRNLTSRHRKSWIIRACLSNTVHPKKMEFQKLGPRSKLTSMTKETNDKVVAQCFPIYSILLAVGRTKIDYLSLDVEGSEFDVLKTIPWDKVEITIISVEYENIKHQKKKMRKFMEREGYSWIDYPLGKGGGFDFLFFRKDLIS